MKPRPAKPNQFTAAVLTVLMAALGWFVHSEVAHDHLHVHPAKGARFTGGMRHSGQPMAGVVTLTPRWLKLGPAPSDRPFPAPAGPHRHRSLAFDSLAAGQWCGLFTSAALPVLELPVVMGLVPHRSVPPLRTHWVLLPGRAPPVGRLTSPV
ncbi:MAG: hypothetical protein EBS05_13035 [Proteobacteria bacterium]|nr:hypothetical protein [Pseudomonadota bacterium]